MSAARATTGTSFRASRRRAVEITLINPKDRARTDGKFRFVDGDATDLAGFDDRSFDFVRSNSVIEHVGDWAKMKAMAENGRRLAPAYCVRSSNSWFPIEPHFRCAFSRRPPEQMRYRLVKRVSFGFTEAKETVDAALASERVSRVVKSWIATRAGG